MPRTTCCTTTVRIATTPAAATSCAPRTPQPAEARSSTRWRRFIAISASTGSGSTSGRCSVATSTVGVQHRQRAHRRDHGVRCRARDIRLIAEPWDLAAYQVGDCVPRAERGRQWNGKFRDDCRSFLRAENGATAAFARPSSSAVPTSIPTIPGRSVNFITAHDGFTLYDLVSYEHKHNAANGQNGNDGTDDNRSAGTVVGRATTCRADWPADFDVDAVRRAARAADRRTPSCSLMMSAGVPMIVAGDEFAQTQHGNNNPYNQDDETTWLDWSRRRSSSPNSPTSCQRRDRACVASHGVGSDRVARCTRPRTRSRLHLTLDRMAAR